MQLFVEGGGRHPASSVQGATTTPEGKTEARIDALRRKVRIRQIRQAKNRIFNQKFSEDGIDPNSDSFERASYILIWDQDVQIQAATEVEATEAISSNEQEANGSKWLTHRRSAA